MIISLLILCNEVDEVKVLEVKCVHSSEKMRLLCFLFVCLFVYCRGFYKLKNLKRRVMLS